MNHRPLPQTTTNNESTKSEAAYLAHLTHNPTDHHAMYALASLLLKTARSEQAITWLKKAIYIEQTNHDYHMTLGVAYLKQRLWQDAQTEFETVLRADENHLAALYHLAALHEQQQQFLDALRYYRKLLQLEPGLIDAHYRLGILFTKLSRTEDAIKQFQNVISLDPQHGKSHHCLGTIYLTEEQLEQAETHLQYAHEYLTEDSDLLVNLGVLELKQNSPQAAVALFAKALALDNHHQEAKSNLAATFLQFKRFDNAWVHYQELISEYPDNQEFRYNGAVALMYTNQLDEAIMHFKALLSINPQHAHAHVNLAAIYSRRESQSQAKYHLEQAIALNPEDVASQHMLNAINGDKISHTPQAYVEQLFDGYAHHYDQHMQETLDYQLPATLVEMIQAYPVVENLLDLGCGTGLMAKTLRPHAKTLIGVDLSNNMLDLAKKTQCYDQLHHLEVCAYLLNNAPTWQMAVATEILPYFGELTDFFTSLGAKADQGAQIILTFETSQTSGFTLHATGRFSHNPAYVQQICQQQGWIIRQQKPLTLRNQHEQKIQGRLIVAEYQPQ